MVARDAVCLKPPSLNFFAPPVIIRKVLATRRNFFSAPPPPRPPVPPPPLVPLPTPTGVASLAGSPPPMTANDGNVGGVSDCVLK